MKRMVSAFFIICILTALISITHESGLNVLVIDMPVNPEILSKNKENFKRTQVLQNVSEPLFINQETCKKSQKLLENFFSFRLKKTDVAPDLNQKSVDALKSIVSTIHGYHIVNLVTSGLQNVQVFTMGLPPIDPEKMNDKNYISLIQENFEFIRRALRDQSIKVVNLSAADTEEETFADLEILQHDPEKNATRAREIIETWRQGWKDLIKDFPETLFIVAAGNGGLDWIGDNLSTGENKVKSIPSTLKFKNIITVASIRKDKNKKNCLSSFSNFGDQFVHVAAAGEQVPAYSPCQADSEVEMTGTSQATARVTNRIVKVLSQNKKIKDYFESLPKDECLIGKVKYGVVK